MSRPDMDEWRSHAASLARRTLRDAEARARASVERRDQLREIARDLARVLVNEEGARRVWLVGSLAGEGGIVHERSDIDMVVEGIPDRAEWSLAGGLADRAGVPVDVVHLERAPSFQETIDAYGELLGAADE